MDAVMCEILLQEKKKTGDGEHLQSAAGAQGFQTHSRAPGLSLLVKLNEKKCKLPPPTCRGFLEELAKVAHKLSSIDFLNHKNVIMFFFPSWFQIYFWAKVKRIPHNDSGMS